MLEVRNVLTGRLVGIYTGSLDQPLDGHDYVHFRRAESGMAWGLAIDPVSHRGYDVQVTVNKLYFGEEFVYFLGVVTDTQMDRVEGYRSVLNY